jgi:hypothetical protein
VRLLDGLRLDPLVAGPVLDDDLDLLVEPPDPVASRPERKAVHLVLGLEPARADPHLHAAAGDVVDGDGVLRQNRRRAKRHRRHEGAEAEPLGDRGERGERGPRVEGRGVGGAADAEVVVGAEQRLDLCVLARAGERDPLLPRHVLLALDHQADAHGRRAYRR